MLGRTAYVCRSAYKRLIEKHNIARWSSFNNTINGKASTDRFQMPMANRKYRKHSLYPWLQSDNMHTSVMNYGSAVFNETDSETDLENILVMGSSSNYGLSYQLDQYEEVWQPTFPISGILQRLRYHELVPLLSPFGIATEYGENYEALSPQRIWNRKEVSQILHFSCCC